MTRQIIMPQSIYFAVVGSRTFPENYFAGDYHVDMDDALDCAINNQNAELGYRIFRLEFDPDTNMPERFSDVTEEAIYTRNEYLLAQGRNPITQDDHFLSEVPA